MVTPPTVTPTTTTTPSGEIPTHTRKLSSPMGMGTCTMPHLPPTCTAVNKLIPTTESRLPKKDLMLPDIPTRSPTPTSLVSLTAMGTCTMPHLPPTCTAVNKLIPTTESRLL